MLHEFIIKIPYKQVDTITEKLNVTGIYNLYYEAPIETVIIQNGYGFEEKEDEDIDFKIYASDLEVENLPQTYFELIETTLSISRKTIAYSCGEETLWEDDFQFEDIDLGNGWMIVYPNSSEVYPTKKILKFDPLAAFGTGLHETTQSCLKLLLPLDLTKKTVLDLGTGSGMLAIGASLVGAKKVVAIDYEEVERELKHNAILNQVNNELIVVQADLIEGDFKITEKYDLVIINIGGDEAVSIVRKHELVKNNNKFIISGMVDWHTEPVITLFKENGFHIKEMLQMNEWITIYFKRVSDTM